MRGPRGGEGREKRGGAPIGDLQSAANGQPRIASDVGPVSLSRPHSASRKLRTHIHFQIDFLVEADLFSYIVYNSILLFSPNDQVICLSPSHSSSMH